MVKVMRCRVSDAGEMKNMEKLIFLTIRGLQVVILLLCVTLFMSCEELGTGNEANKERLKYVPLEEGAGNYGGTVYDEKTQTELEELSFYGQTTLGGVRNEASDVVEQLDMENMREIIILDSDFVSDRYENKHFILADVVLKNGSKLNKLLIPPKVMICGIDRITRVPQVWQMAKIDRLIIGGQIITVEPKNPLEQSIPAEEIAEEKTKTPTEAFIAIIDAVLEFFRSIWHAIGEFFGFYKSTIA